MSMKETSCHLGNIVFQTPATRHPGAFDSLASCAAKFFVQVQLGGMLQTWCVHGQDIHAKVKPQAISSHYAYRERPKVRFVPMMAYYAEHC